VHSTLQPTAIAEVLAQHYNVGITNPWFEAGLSEQETYTRRQLPWSGNNYEVSPSGNVSGANASKIPEGLKEQWRRMSEASRNIGAGERYENLEALYNDRLVKIGEALSYDQAFPERDVNTASGGTTKEKVYTRPAKRSAPTASVSDVETQMG